MASPYLGEIKILSFPTPPAGWAKCDGQLLLISQNTPLFNLLGTIYGGNGTTTFALPNLRGRVPIHPGNGYTLGGAGGEATHTVSIAAMPSHTHPVNVLGQPMNGEASDPTNCILGKAPANMYGDTNSLVAMSPLAVGSAGSFQPHNNMMPYLTLNFVISLQGPVPPRFIIIKF